MGPLSSFSALRISTSCEVAMVWEESEQRAARRLLTGAVAAGRVAHAYLFLGPDGRGKEEAARWLAQALNCETGPGTPCGRCRSCHLIAAGTHPDVRTFAPSGRYLRLEDVRALCRAVGNSPLVGRAKVYLVKEADKLLPEAANHLLKVLEEPPADTFFLLSAERPYALMPTVVSRCQVVPFHPLPPEKVAELLVAEGHAPQLAHRAAYLAGGDVKAAAGWLEEEGRRAQETFLALAPRLPAGRGALVTAAEAFAQDAGRFLTLLGAWYRDLLVWLTGCRDLICFQGAEAAIGRAAAFYRPVELVRANRAIEKATRRFSGRSNVNVRLAFEALLVELIVAAGTDRRPQRR